MENEEIWRKIEGWPYDVSNIGRVRKTATQQIMAGGLSVYGYRTVTLRRRGRYPSFAWATYVHRLVALAFIGPCPNGLEVNHKDGDKSNNRLENLEYVTGSENIRYAVANGTFPVGTRRWNARLTPEKVGAIREAHAAGTRVAAIAVLAGVSEGTVYHVVRNHNWRHVA